MPPDLQAQREALRQRALEAGFAHVGFTTADPLDAETQRRWACWLAEGRAAEMDWLARPRPRRTHPRDLMDAARTVMVAAAAYYDGDHDHADGKIARYAWGRDYHRVLRARLEAIGQWAAGRVAETGNDSEPTFRVCVDSAPIDERALAVRAGLGFIGRHTLLIAPEGGSWLLLGLLLLSWELPPDDPPTCGEVNCGTCRRCVEACPTGALDVINGRGRLDPRRCLAYLTVEHKGDLPPDARLDGWAFGCDRCQEVCPHNRRPLPRVLPELAADAGFGPRVSRETLDTVASGKAFLRRWGHTPLARGGLRRLRRNVDCEG